VSTTPPRSHWRAALAQATGRLAPQFFAQYADEAECSLENWSGQEGYRLAAVVTYRDLSLANADAEARRLRELVETATGRIAFQVDILHGGLRTIQVIVSIGPRDHRIDYGDGTLPAEDLPDLADLATVLGIDP
jgi:hypothetical protein